ncbi:MAG: hypothetical protein ACP6IY_11645 [Promethearchaeia archaeon]
MPNRKNKSKVQNYIFTCYNCNTEIIDNRQIRCPNCNVILRPNDYVNWSLSWWSFLCCILLIPFLIAFILIGFS